MIIIWVIVVSSIKQIVDTYSDQIKEQSMIDLLTAIDYTVNFIFIVECVVKVVSQGFVLDSGSYLRDSWSQLDFLIVVFSIMDMSIDGNGYGYLKVFMNN